MKKETKGLLFATAITTGAICGYTYGKFNHYFEALLTNKLPCENEEKECPWLQEVESYIVRCYGEDGVVLKGRLFPRKRSKKWVILVHDYQKDCTSMFDCAKVFYDHGYNALCVDCRCHGMSKANAIGMGWLDSKDLKEWIKEIIQINANSKIVLYGVGMGASAVMMATGEELPHVVCAIADSGYSSAKAMLQYCLKKEFYISSNYMMKHLNYLCKKKADYTIEDANCLSQLNKSKIPTLFIHGKEDEVVPYSMVFDNYNACNAEKDLIVVEDGKHAQSSLSKEYFPRIFHFIQSYL